MLIIEKKKRFSENSVHIFRIGMDETLEIKQFSGLLSAAKNELRPLRIYMFTFAKSFTT